MAIDGTSSVPYAPAQSVLDIVYRYREHDLPTPFTTEVLARAGVSDSLQGRTLASLVGLELIDEDGNPTPALQALAEAPSSSFDDALADHVRSVYAEVFKFVDPAKGSYEQVQDAFRSYNPRGQRNRMVTLFLGLCEAAGIVEEAPTPNRAKRRGGGTGKGTTTGSNGTPASRSKGAETPAKRDTPRTGENDEDRTPRDRLPLPITSVLDKLPVSGGGWSKGERQRFLEAFNALLDLYYPVKEENAASQANLFKDG